jgi:hypothetical protein
MKIWIATDIQLQEGVGLAMEGAVLGIEVNDKIKSCEKLLKDDFLC